ncbi:MAG: hypothetical protein DCC75_01850, partial [Proteobacteria bacterium]
RIIRFFDLDGTLAETDSLLRVVRRGDGKEVMLVTPEEYAEEPTREYWEDRAAKQNPDTPREDLQLSFLEFEEESRITRRVRERLRHNELFKRKLKSWDPARSAG